MNRILSGIQPTRELHIGNYLGALRQWVRSQDDHDSFFCIVDLHAIESVKDPAEFTKAIRNTVATYLACGINPESNTIFIQSHVPAHSQLAWILGCSTPLGWLNRMTQFKDKAGKHKETANLGLYAYPVLQAADILVYQANHVPVGEDQKQHIELCRDIAGAFNSKYGVDFFTLPEPMISDQPEARIMSLRDGTKKMSKSDSSEYSRINLNDDADTIALKVRKAKTDPDPIAGAFDQMEDRPEAKNLISIYASLAEAPLDSVCQQFEGAQFSEFKGALTELLVDKLSPITAEINHLMQDPGELDRIIGLGAAKANEVATDTLAKVHRIIGLV